MTTPFFSVVIPTKNRSFLVGLAIQSILRQSFDNFEIVVADNDDTDATRPVIESFNDSRINYYRTGGLSMPDNWEFAVSKAQGEYVAILEDKQVLRKHALERVFKEVETTRYPVVGWLYDRYYDTQQPPKIIKTESNGDVELISSMRIIEAFLKQGRVGECDRLLPRGLNSCIHQTLIDQIRSGPAGRLCLHVAPDFSMGFQQLAYCDSILHIDEALVVVGGFSYSTGRTVKIDRDALTYFQGSEWDDALCYNRVPVKTLTIAGSLYNDYENVRLLVGGNLSRYPLDMKTYFVQCFRDIQNSRRMGADVSVEMAEWTRALTEQDPSFQNTVYQVLLADETAANISMTSELAELKISRDNWIKKSKNLEKGFHSLENRVQLLETKFHLLKDAYNFIRRSSPIYWLLRLTKSPRIKFDVSSNIELPPSETKDSIQCSNVLEYIMWDEMNQTA
jgi:hypothetical protein